jgi:hypothetical protein
MTLYSASLPVTLHSVENEAVPVVFRLGGDSVGREPQSLELAGPAAALSAVHLRWLHGGDTTPLSSVGIVFAGPESAAGAIEEFVRHADHYLDSAARGADAVRKAHTPDAVLEGLLA